MTYKYEEIVTVGANGTSITHRSTEDNPIFKLGHIGKYTYIQTDGLVAQHQNLVFVEVVLTDIEKTELKTQPYIKMAKLSARSRIRNIKDLEDDLTDQKQLVQFMARGFAGLWLSLPDELKVDNPYKDNFDAFSDLVVNSSFRLDLESNQAAKIGKIINDESDFANIVQDEYLSKL